jgi:hypothetical protein
VHELGETAFRLREYVTHVEYRANDAVPAWIHLVDEDSDGSE